MIERSTTTREEEVSKIPPVVKYTEGKEWYHIECVTVPKKALENSSVEWKCAIRAHRNKL